MSRRLVHFVLLTLFVLINAAISAPPAAALLGNDICIDGEEVTACCTSCLIFCRCDTN